MDEQEFRSTCHAALRRHSDLDALPYPEIMQAVVRFEGRPQRRRKV